MTRTNLSLVAALALGALLCSPSFALAQSLGAAQNFAIVGGSQVTAAVGAAPSPIAGDVGVSPGLSITGFPPALGGIVIAPFSLHVPNDGPSVAAQAAVTALFTDLTTRGGAATTLSSNQLAGRNLGPGVYNFPGGGDVNLSSGGLLTLTGNGTYIFRVPSTLTTISTSNILLVGAQACNIWWQVGSSATLGGTTFAGNVVGFTGVNSMGPNATLEGRLLTTTPGSVTLSGDNTVNAAFCAIVPPPGPIGVTKTFSPAANGPGGISTLVITLTNDNGAQATLLAPLVDTLPSGVVVAANPNISTTCDNGVVTAPAGGGSITLGVGSHIPSGGVGACIVRVDITSATLGSYTNRIPIGALQTSNGNNIAPAIAVLAITNITPVPTLTQWATIMLAVLLALGGFIAMRQRRSPLR